MMNQHLEQDDPAVTSGAISAKWAVRLLDDLDCETYRAVLGPPSQRAPTEDAQLLQVYLFRRQLD